MLRSRLMSGVRPFYAAAGDPPAGGDQGDGNNQGGDQGAGGAEDGDAGGNGTGDSDQGTGTGDGGAGGDAATVAKAAADKAAADAAALAATATGDGWKDKEIRRKHAQLQEAKRRETELAAENETLRAIAARNSGGAGGDDAGGDPPARAQPQPSLSRDDVQAEAQRLVAQQNFDKSANDADAAGRTRYKADWDKATETLKTLGGFDVPTMNAILATDDPAQVLYLLGSKPEEYQRIMELPDARRQNELVKLGIPVKKAAVKPSDAPPPVDSTGTRARGDGDSLADDVPDETWYARRKRQKDARFAARQQNRA